MLGSLSEVLLITARAFLSELPLPPKLDQKGRWGH